jgi:hypothetical protein
MARLSDEYIRDVGRKEGAVDSFTNDSDRKDDDEQIEVAARTPEDSLRPGRRQKFKRHCARWWWLHLLTFCVLFLLIALLLVYVAMPKIAQHGVNESYIEFTEIDFMDPSPTSMLLTQKGILHSPSIYTPTLDAFNASLATVINGTIGEPFVTIPMPQIHALHPTSTFTLTNTVTYTNLTSLGQYVVAMLTSENVTSALSGKTKLHEGALPVVNVNYNTQSTYKALNGLQDLNVTDARINISAPTDEPNFSAITYIPNPSVLTVAMGNVTLSLSTEKEGIVGNATILNMTIKPGANNFPMTATINETLVLSSMNATTGFVDMIITGTASVYNGQHLTYYEKALSENVFNLAMNVKQILADSLTS